MVVKVLELKNCSTESINIGSHVVNPNETFRIALNKISNVMWKNVIALVNKKEAIYKVVDVKEEEPKKVIENEKIEEPKEEKTTIKKTTKKKETTKESTTKKKTTTKKKKEEN